jgi:membrane protease YdiL (CAAX protease family)
MTTTQNVTRTPAPLREVVAFLAITFALALSLAIALPDAGVNVGLTALFPTVALVILTFTMFRRGTRRELWRSIGLSRLGLRSWGWALGLPILLCGGAFGTALLVGAGRLQTPDLTPTAVGGFAATSAFVFLQVLIGALGEEIGWRGFMLPRVQQLTGKRRAALVTGFVHGCFHLPLILIATTYDAEGPRWIAALAAVLLITAAGVFYAWLRDRSGSVWPVAIGHAFANTTFGWGFTVVASTGAGSLVFVAGETGVATFACVAVLALVLLTTATVWKTAPVATSSEVAVLPGTARVHDAADA